MSIPCVLRSCGTFDYGHHSGQLAANPSLEGIHQNIVIHDTTPGLGKPEFSRVKVKVSSAMFFHGEGVD